jgi:hypothetical protein
MEAPIGILRRVIWEKGFEEELCIGSGRFKKCVKAGGAVRIMQKDSGYFIELKLLGAVIEYSLINTCYPAYTIGIASLEVCITDIDLSGSTLKGLGISIKFCIGKWGISKCWDIYNGKIRFFLVNLSEIDGDLFEVGKGVSAENILVGVEQ